MLISYSNKFIFIHNYKVAGTSIVNALKKHSLINPSYNHEINSFCERNNLLKTLNYYITKKTSFFQKFEPHSTAIKVKDNIPENIWNEYFKFGFVRNPWSWQVSLYHYMLKKRSPSHFQYNEIKDINSFEDYLDWRVNKDLHLQKEMICTTDGKIMLDFVGKMENIESDFTKICNTIGVKAKLPRLNTTNHRDYRSYYNKNTSRIIEKYFIEDIELFNYDF